MVMPMAALGGIGYLWSLRPSARAEEEEHAAPQENTTETQVQELSKPKEESEEEDLMGEPILKTITNANLREVLKNKENKFIYFYSKATSSLEEYKRVEEFSQKIANGMRVVPYKINLDECYTELAAYLKERNPKTAEQTEEQIATHQFLLANQYDDIWYWELDLMNFFYGELLEQIFNFYQGPLHLVSHEQLIMNQSGDNDFHVVAFVPKHMREETLKNLKNFRKFNTKNTDRFFHYKFWLVEDPELAKQMKIETEDTAAGDIYLLRPSSIFSLDMPNTKLCGYDYYSTKILSGEDVAKDTSGSASYAKILEHAFNSPIIVRDYMQFAVLNQKFKTNALVIYCDPQEDPVFYKQVLKALVRARKSLPINLTPDASGELQKQQRHSDVLLVLSTVKNLMPIVKLHESGPQALFVTPEDNVVDLLANQLSHIEKIEGLPKEEFKRKAANVDQEFAYLDQDDDRERNRKDTQKLIYSPDRFIMPRMHHTADRAILTDPEKLVEFVKSAVLGQLPLYWETDKVPKVKHSQKVVGEDFEKRVLDSKKDAILLINHPVKGKNSKLQDQFEEFSRIEKSKNHQILFGRYNGVNESQGFKSPEKLPTILYFKTQLDSNGEPTGEPKEVTVYEGINELLLKGSSDSDVQDALREFLQKCNKHQTAT